MVPTEQRLQTKTRNKILKMWNFLIIFTIRVHARKIRANLNPFRLQRTFLEVRFLINVVMWPPQRSELLETSHISRYLCPEYSAFVPLAGTEVVGQFPVPLPWCSYFSVHLFKCDASAQNTHCPSRNITL